MATEEDNVKDALYVIQSIGSKYLSSQKRSHWLALQKIKTAVHHALGEIDPTFSPDEEDTQKIDVIFNAIRAKDTKTVRDTLNSAKNRMDLLQLAHEVNSVLKYYNDEHESPDQDMYDTLYDFIMHSGDSMLHYTYMTGPYKIQK